MVIANELNLILSPQISVQMKTSGVLLTPIRIPIGIFGNPFTLL